MEKLFSTFEVAKICQVSPASVSRWIREGKLASSVTAGGHHRVGAEALSAFLKALRMPIPPELFSFRIRRVLIADQDAKTRKRIRRDLEHSFAEMSVEEAGDGFEAGWKAHALKPHLIILDFSVILNAAGSESGAFLKRLNGAGDAGIILTGHQEEMNHFGQQNSGKIRAFVRKPLDAEILKQKVRECLSREPEGKVSDKAG